MAHHIGLQVLRAKLRGFHAAGSTISSRIRKATGQHRNNLWNDKRLLGGHCRHHIIAYGFLRGVPYILIEQCAANNRPNPQYVLDIMVLHNKWDPKRGYVSYDLAMVKQLLAGGVGRWVKQGGIKPPVWVIEAFQSPPQEPPVTLTASSTTLASTSPASTTPPTVTASSVTSPVVSMPMPPIPCPVPIHQSTSGAEHPSVGQSVVRLLEKIMGGAR